MLRIKNWKIKSNHIHEKLRRVIWSIIMLLITFSSWHTMTILKFRFTMSKIRILTIPYWTIFVQRIHGGVEDKDDEDTTHAIRWCRKLYWSNWYVCYYKATDESHILSCMSDIMWNWYLAYPEVFSLKQASYAMKTVSTNNWYVNRKQSDLKTSSMMKDSIHISWKINGFQIVIWDCKA